MLSLYLSCTVIAYLMGSISSAILICKAFGLADPRTQGSGNPGATNVLRLGGKLPAALVFVSDCLKGLLPVLLAKWLHFPDLWLGLVGLAAFLGHLYPIFFRFQGGKGIATAFGVVLALSLSLAGILFAIWFIIILMTRYVSLASMLAAAALPLFAYWLQQSDFTLALSLMAILTIWRHRNNIVKLCTGMESKLGSKR
jgi:glycerol-3-phosphate acyltransferase PlsY